MLESRLVPKMKEIPKSLKVTCQRYLDYICQNSSCHGGNWAMKIKSTKLKIILQIIAILLQCLMLLAFIYALFVREVEVTNWQIWDKNDGSFPNLTICNHRIFDKRKTEGLHISFFLNSRSNFEIEAFFS